VHEVDGVTNPDGELTTNMNAVLTQHEDGTFLAQTLGIRPLPDVVQGIRSGSKSCPYGKDKTYSGMQMLKKKSSSSVEIKATVSSATGGVGLIVGAAADMSEYTRISYEPSNHTLLVVRDHSSTLRDNFNTATVTGYFYPYTVVSDDGSAAQESITMDVFLDGSLLEVYLNDRFALATRIYPASECSTGSTPSVAKCDRRLMRFFTF
jgi:sucrose-6-phosphate hydrolase SacC (GH32 family)